jgi:hypothetical protein
MVTKPWYVKKPNQSVNKIFVRQENLFVRRPKGRSSVKKSPFVKKTVLLRNLCVSPHS